MTTLLADLTPEQRAHAVRIADAFFAEHGSLYAQTADPVAVQRIWEVARDNVLCAPPPGGALLHEQQSEWSEPIPLTDLHGLPDFPTELLPAWLRDFVDAVATEIQTARCVPAMIALSVVSAALARKVAVHVRGNWTEALNLYVAVALGPSNLKTPAFKMACAPLETFERAKAQELRPAITEAETRRANLQASLDAARRRVARRRSEVDSKDAMRDAEALAKELGELHVPHPPQLIATDVTEESLGILLAEHDGRIAIMSDEGGPFRNMAGRYQRNGSPFFEIFKHAHNASTVRVNRAGRPPIHVPLAAVTLGLMVQPSLLRSLKDTSEFRGEGLLARFLYAVPESKVGSRNLRADGVPRSVAQEYQDRVAAILGFPFGSDQFGGTAPHVVELTPEARECVVAFREGLEPRIGRGGDLAHIDDWAGKLAGAAARIAAILHLAQLATQSEPWRTPVPELTMRSGVTIARDFLLPHGLAAFSLIGGGPVSDLAEEVLAWIRRHKLNRFTKRDVHRHLRRQVGNAGEWDAPLALLAEHGWIQEAEDDQPKVGRPSYEYCVNPALFRSSGTNRGNSLAAASR